MSNIITLSAIVTHDINKTLEIDSEGYYHVILGAVNSFNSVGMFYAADGIENILYNNNGILQRRISQGYLYGEANHPAMLPGMTKADYLNRYLSIDMQCVSHFIKDVSLTQTSTPGKMPGYGNLILVEGWVKPTGPHGATLKAALEDKNINVPFSVRALTQDRMVGGVLVRKIKEIVTWDFINEPGIFVANKFHKLSMESMSSVSYDLDDLFEGDEIKQCVSCALEDNTKSTLTDIYKKCHNCDTKMLNW